MVGGQCQDFPLKICCPTVPKNAVGEPFSHSLISGIEKVWIRGEAEGEWSSSILCRIFFVSQCRKLMWGKPSVLCFRNIPAAKKFMDKKGVSRFSVESFLSHSAKKFRRGTPMCCVS